MFTVNTQLAFFVQGEKIQKLLVNITWFRLESDTMRVEALSRTQIEQFMKFIEKHAANFPGDHFVQDASRDKSSMPFQINNPSSALPYYFVLSNSIQPSFDKYFDSVTIQLLDKCSQNCISYNLDFDLAGKIEVFKKM